MNAITFRSATVADAPQVADIHLRSRRAFLPFAPLAHDDADVHRWMRETVIPAGGVTIACEDGSVIGYLAVARDEDGFDWIEQLYMAPGHTGRGTGTRLLELALSTLRRPIRLYVFQPNTGARALYERHGFRPIAFGDGSGNEERCPDVLYELTH